MTGVAGRPIVLVGMMGVGKTTVGRIVADLLGWPFVDLDDAIERRDGRVVGTIFAEEGESRFRQLESQCLADLLASTDSPFVLSTGGGVVVTDENRSLLVSSSCDVVLLEGSLDELTKRVRGGSRPLLQGDARSALSALWNAREPQYREVAGRTVTTDDRRVDQVASAIIQGMKVEA